MPLNKARLFLISSKCFRKTCSNSTLANAWVFSSVFWILVTHANNLLNYRLHLYIHYTYVFSFINSIHYIKQEKNLYTFLYAIKNLFI